MLPIRTILHPTDYSSLSERAFHLACSLARDHGSRLIVLHVVVPPPVAPDVGLAPPPGGDWAALEDELRRVQAPDTGVPLEYRLELGDPATEILRMAAETHCDLIVLGTHGRTGLARLLMGSVAEQVVRQAPCPVLTVKTPLAEPPAA